MIKVILEIDTQLYRLLQSAAKSNHLSFDEECRRRLEGTERRSRYLQALVAELRADDEQRRTDTR
jgi:3-methyladenine DNA glycosylase/8-oxoguanine DNA glycosylase